MQTVTKVVEDILHAAAERAVNRVRCCTNLSPDMERVIREAVKAMTSAERDILQEAVSDAISYSAQVNADSEAATARLRGGPP